MKLTCLEDCFYCFGSIVKSVVGTEGVVEDWMVDVDSRVQFGVDFAKGRGMVKSGDPIIIVTGWQKGSGFTNTMRIVYANGTSVAGK